MPPLLRRLALWCAMAGCCAACLVAMLTVVSIVGRTFWSWPIPGDVELTQFGIALCIALCLPWCQLQRGNIIVDFFTQRSGPRTKRWLDGVGSLLLAVMVGLLAWRSGAGALAVGEANETTMILGLPMWVSYAALAPGLALTSLIALLQVFTGVEVRE
ncbi:TRAP-type C4-dicarboxylate transport system permease small subunit [Roseateles toxinivorans]|uniref:TRAP transporter small permease protein n=2 Tax=Roseateles toxinivorans TaxID=270368 RepID=A0A4R6QJB7_9BURK|nr:TRAP-type C4-dicarboxylate transport system permease small subunit [Roseateles toxinivorans]